MAHIITKGEFFFKEKIPDEESKRALKKSKNMQRSLITAIKIDSRDYFIDETRLEIYF